MKDTVTMSMVNPDGIKIIKEVPMELYSNYLAIGWKVEKEPKSQKENKSLNSDTKVSKYENI